MVALVTKISYDRALVCITQVRSLFCQRFWGWAQTLSLFLEPSVPLLDIIRRVGGRDNGPHPQSNVKPLPQDLGLPNSLVNLPLTMC